MIFQNQRQRGSFQDLLAAREKKKKILNYKEIPFQYKEISQQKPSRLGEYNDIFEALKEKKKKKISSQKTFSGKVVLQKLRKINTKHKI